MAISELVMKTYTYLFGGTRFMNRMSMELGLLLTMGSRRNTIKKAFAIIDEQGVPLFARVEIETINRCNGSCTFCPVNKNDDPRRPEKMTNELFDKIINELHDLDYSGAIGLFANNEPFLDTRLEEFAKKTRELIPKARIEVYSNGTLIELDRFINIIPYLDLLVIDNYNDKLQYNEPTKAIQAYLKENPEHKDKVSIRMRRETAMLSARGGQAPNNKKKKPLPLSCLLPFYHLYIRPDGKTGLCCVDALAKYTLGDVSAQSLKDVWYGDDYGKIREKIREGRDTLDVCKHCDSFGNAANLHIGKKEVKNEPA